MPEHELAAILREEAAHGRSPDKRRRQIDSVMKWLREHGRLPGGLEEAA
jgi:hypothetical protein